MLSGLSVFQCIVIAEELITVVDDTVTIHIDH